MGDGYEQFLEVTKLTEELDAAAALMGVTRFQVAGSVKRLHDDCQRYRRDLEKAEDDIMKWRGHV